MGVCWVKVRAGFRGAQNSTLHAGKVSSCMATVLLLPSTVTASSRCRSWVCWYHSCITRESKVGIKVTYKKKKKGDHEPSRQKHEQTMHFRFKSKIQLAFGIWFYISTTSTKMSKQFTQLSSHNAIKNHYFLTKYPCHKTCVQPRRGTSCTECKLGTRCLFSLCHGRIKRLVLRGCCFNERGSAALTCMLLSHRALPSSSASSRGLMTLSLRGSSPLIT